MDLSSKEINKAVEIINKYSHTEILKDWDKMGLTKYTVKKELDDENYKILAERLIWKIMGNNIFGDIDNI